MTVVLTVGTLSIISLVVLAAVSIPVSVVFLFIARSKILKVQRCSRCHGEVCYQYVRIPPHYQIPTLRNDPFGATNKTEAPITEEEAPVEVCNGNSCQSATKCVPVTPAQCQANSLMIKSEEKDYKFQRSCSTRKKINRRGTSKVDKNTGCRSGTIGLFRQVFGINHKL